MSPVDQERMGLEALIACRVEKTPTQQPQVRGGVSPAKAMRHQIPVEQAAFQDYRKRAQQDFTVLEAEIACHAQKGRLLLMKACENVYLVAQVKHQMQTQPDASI